MAAYHRAERTLLEPWVRTCSRQQQQQQQCRLSLHSYSIAASCALVPSQHWLQHRLQHREQLWALAPLLKFCCHCRCRCLCLIPIYSVNSEILKLRAWDFSSDSGSDSDSVSGSSSRAATTAVCCWLVCRFWFSSKHMANSNKSDVDDDD